MRRWGGMVCGSGNVHKSHLSSRRECLNPEEIAIHRLLDSAQIPATEDPSQPVLRAALFMEYLFERH